MIFPTAAEISAPAGVFRVIIRHHAGVYTKKSSLPKGSEGTASKCSHFEAVPSEKRLLTPPESNFARLSRAKPPFSQFLQAGISILQQTLMKKHFQGRLAPRISRPRRETAVFFRFLPAEPLLFSYLGRNSLALKKAAVRSIEVRRCSGTGPEAGER